MELVFKASEFERQFRFRKYQDTAAEFTGQFRVDPHDRADMNAEIHGLERGPFMFNAFKSFDAPMAISRTRSMIRPEDADFYWVTAVTAGDWAVRTGDADVVMKRGELMIFDPADETFVKYLPDGPTRTSAIVNITLPKTFLTAASGILPVKFPLYVPRSNPMATLLFGMIEHVCEMSSALPDDQIGIIIDRLSDLLCETVIDNFRYRDEAQTYEATHRWVVKSAVERNLADPLLSVEAISVMCGRDLPYLLSLFSEEAGGFENYVRQRRLERIRADLERPDQLGVDLSDIARRRGWVDLPGLDKALTDMFGIGVAELRGRARENRRGLDNPSPLAPRIF